MCKGQGSCWHSYLGRGSALVCYRPIFYSGVQYIGGAVTKINYLKVTLLQTDNPLVRQRIFEPSPHPRSALTLH